MSTVLPDRFVTTCEGGRERGYDPRTTVEETVRRLRLKKVNKQSNSVTVC